MALTAISGGRIMSKAIKLSKDGKTRRDPVMTGLKRETWIGILLVVLTAIAIPVGTWIYGYHVALASDIELEEAVDKVTAEVRADRRRDLLKSNREALDRIDDKVIEYEVYTDKGDKKAEAAIKRLELRRIRLEKDRDCIVETGRECDEAFVS